MNLSQKLELVQSIYDWDEYKKKKSEGKKIFIDKTVLGKLVGIMEKHDLRIAHVSEETGIPQPTLSQIKKRISLGKISEPIIDSFDEWFDKNIESIKQHYKDLYATNA